MIVETEAVVLHTMKYGDTSKIVSLYSKKFGKIKIIAKGVRSQKNKFGSSLEPMTISSVVIYKKEHKDLHLLSKSEIAIPLNAMQDNSDRMYIGLALIELVNMVMHDEEENRVVYDLLQHSLETLEISDRNHANVLMGFMLKMYEQFGFGISLGNCVICSKALQDLVVQFVQLRLSDGKFICSQCSEEHGSTGIEVGIGMLKSLHFLQSNDIKKSTMLMLANTQRNKMIEMLQSYLRYHIEGTRTLQSLSLLYSTT